MTDDDTYARGVLVLDLHDILELVHDETAKEQRILVYLGLAVLGHRLPVRLEFPDDVPQLLLVIVFRVRIAYSTASADFAEAPVQGAAQAVLEILHTVCTVHNMARVIVVLDQFGLKALQDALHRSALLHGRGR